MEEETSTINEENEFSAAADRSEVIECDDIYLSMFHCAQQLGAAFYNVSDGILYVMNDLADPAPQHRLVFSLLAQIDPKYLLVSSRHNETIGEQVKKTDENSSSSGMSKNTSTLETSTFATLEKDSKLCESFQRVEVIVLPGKSFAFESCRQRVLSQKLPGESEFSASEDHYLAVQSMISPTCEAMIRACGALLKFLDKNKIGGMNLDCGGVPILAIKLFIPQDVIYIDETTLDSLQIFSALYKNSGSRSGRYNQKREGLSIYSLVNKTKSPNGSKYLKYMLRCLPRDIQVIANRQNALAYFMHPSQLETVRLMKEALSKIRSIHQYLKKLNFNQVSVPDWKALKSTLTHMLYLSQICANTVALDSNAPHVIQCIGEKVHGDSALSALVQTIEKVFDVELSESRCRFIVKPRVDDVLDEKKRVHNGLPNLLLQLAEEEVEHLPDCMESCTMVYVPQIGYMLAIEPWDGMPETEDGLLEQFTDLKYIFTTNHVPHFKSRRCIELDQSMGDTATNISDHEISIMLQLSKHIVDETELLVEFSHLVSQLDCLLGLAAASKENNWVRPKINEDGILTIQDGRHPLQELCISTFVPNDTNLGGCQNKAMILTGPNACGKSVYLKQVGIICYLAHLGCWVPAKDAVIPIIDGIYTRIQTLDSIALGLSAFTVDLNQMSRALNNFSGNTLILVDEFGKGTTEKDGQALLGACIDHWCQQGIENNPFVLGYVQHSEAKHIAQKAGIDQKILKRSEAILESLSKGNPIRMNSFFEKVDFPKLIQICEEFLNLDLNEENVEEMFKKVTEILE